VAGPEVPRRRGTSSQEPLREVGREQDCS